MRVCVSGRVVLYGWGQVRKTNRSFVNTPMQTQQVREKAVQVFNMTNVSINQNICLVSGAACMPVTVLVKAVCWLKLAQKESISTISTFPVQLR